MTASNISSDLSNMYCKPRLQKTKGVAKTTRKILKDNYLARKRSEVQKELGISAIDTRKSSSKPSWDN